MATIQITEKKAKHEKKSEKLGIKGIISYGLGNVAGTAEYGLKTSYHMAFMTEFAGINAGFAGMVSMIMTIWDAINDPVIGGIADRTKTKLGKYRPHMLWGIIAWSLITVLLFIVPDLSITGRNFYYTVLLFFWSISCTAYMVPWQSLNSVMTTDVNERNRLLTVRMFIGTLSTTLVSLLLNPVVNAVDGGKKGYFFLALIVVIPSLICALICIKGAGKRDYEGSIPNPPKAGFKKQLKIFLGNAPVICISLMLGLLWLNSGVATASAVYYHTYVTKRMYLITYSALVSMIAGLTIVPIMPALFRKLGRYKTMIVGTAFCFVSPVLHFVYREAITDIAVLTSNFFFMTGTSMVNMSIVSYVPDCADYTELHHGNPNAGVINAMVSFAKKAVSSLSTAIIGVVLTVVGYSAGEKTASQELVDGIINLRGITTIVVFVLILIILALFPIKGSYAKNLRAQLSVVRAEREKQEKS